MEIEVNIDPDEEMKNFGSFMKKSRKKKHLTQAELAEQSGLSVMSIRRYESNERQPGLEEMIKLGKVLGFVMSVDADFQKTIHTEGNFLLDENWQNNITSLGEEHNKTGQLIKLFMNLNSAGKDKAIEMITMLTHVPEYTKTEDQSYGQSD